jgi:hypothetical protein
MDSEVVGLVETDMVVEAVLAPLGLGLGPAEPVAPAKGLRVLLRLPVAAKLLDAMGDCEALPVMVGERVALAVSVGEPVMVRDTVALALAHCEAVAHTEGEGEGEGLPVAVGAAGVMDRLPVAETLALALALGCAALAVGKAVALAPP